MGYGEMIRGFREAQEWRQSDLAERLGCSPGYIAYIETEKRQPSPEFLVALVNVLELPEAQREILLEAVDRARREITERKVRARATAINAAVRTMAGQTEWPDVPDDVQRMAEAMAQELADDSAWRALVKDIRTAYANPTFRDAVVQAARAWAEVARSGRPEQDEGEK